MPLSFRPNAKVWISLDSDAEIEESKRPAFACKVLTCEQVDDWYETVQKLAKDNASYDEVAQALLHYIDDWRNFPEPFTPAGLKKYLTRNEVWKLAVGLVGKVSIAEEDLGKSDSPSRTVGAASASPAPTDAATPPPNANPS